MGPGGGRVAKSPGRLAKFYVRLARGFVDMCQHEKEKAKAVVASPPGRLATTW
jgi:hypothetical protein